jgi:hypothetical protein
MYKDKQNTERQCLKTNSILNKNVLGSWKRTKQDNAKRGLKEGGKRRYLERLNDRMKVEKKRT